MRKKTHSKYYVLEGRGEKTATWVESNSGNELGIDWKLDGPKCGSVPRFEINGARTKGNEKKAPR